MSRPERKRGYPRHKRRAPLLGRGQHLYEGVSAVDMQAVLEMDWTRAQQVWAAGNKELAKGERQSLVSREPWVYPPDFDNARNRRRERRQGVQLTREEQINRRPIDT